MVPVKHSFVKTTLLPAALVSGLLVLVGAAALLLAATRAPAPPAAALAAAPAAGPARQAVTATATVTSSEVVTQTDPFSVLNVFDLLPGGGTLVKESVLNLGGDETNEVLLAADVTRALTNTAGVVETTTIGTMAVLRYSRDDGAWLVQWETGSTALPGRIQGLPETQGDGTRRYQAGDLLRTGQPILLLRTYEAPQAPDAPPTIHLRLWAWTGDTAVPLRMTGADGAAGEAHFIASSDVQTADLDDDGVIEIIVDSAAHTDIYRWDKTHFVIRP